MLASRRPVGGPSSEWCHPTAEAGTRSDLVWPSLRFSPFAPCFLSSASCAISASRLGGNARSSGEGERPFFRFGPEIICGTTLAVPLADIQARLGLEIGSAIPRLNAIRRPASPARIHRPATPHSSPGLYECPPRPVNGYLLGKHGSVGRQRAIGPSILESTPEQCLYPGNSRTLGVSELLLSGSCPGAGDGWGRRPSTAWPSC
jgi:hypothetical protein